MRDRDGAPVAVGRDFRATASQLKKIHRANQDQWCAATGIRRNEMSAAQERMLGEKLLEYLRSIPGPYGLEINAIEPMQLVRVNIALQGDEFRKTETVIVGPDEFSSAR